MNYSTTLAEWRAREESHDTMKAALLHIVERAHGHECGQLHDIVEIARAALAQHTLQITVSNVLTT